MESKWTFFGSYCEPLTGTCYSKEIVTLKLWWYRSSIRSFLQYCAKSKWIFCS